MAIAVALGILVMTLGAPAFAATQPLVVKNVSLSGGIVQVTVKNVSSAAAQSTVAVQAVVNGIPVWSFVPVILNAGQSAVVSAGFTAPVSSVVKVGMTDDPGPI